MAKLTLANGKEVGDNLTPYIIAELNTSHFGNLETAKEMIIEVKKSGADCVKFQSWTDDSLYSKTFYTENPISKRFVTKFSLSKEKLLELVLFSKKLGIDFASTPYSIDEAEYLIDVCNVPFIKVASMDLNNVEFLEYLATKKIPIILSTGMSTIEEISISVNCIEKKGGKFALLHCVALYPTQPYEVNLRNILYLKEKFPNVPIGFSDHTEGIEVSVGAISVGASIIEKHFTLDKSRIGMDNQMAIGKEELQNLVNSCRNVYNALGTLERIVSPKELVQRLKLRRSVVSTRELKPNSIVVRQDLTLKRPGNGIPPEDLESILGKRVTKRIEADTLIQREDIE
jgi:sialic acid synthase SpsE